MSNALLPDQTLPWPIVWPAVAFIAQKEACRLRAYKNYPNEPWTCGWGETDGVGPNTVWTQDFADQRFCDSLTHFTDAVRAACTVEPNANELGALVSLAYNIGLGWQGKIKPAGAKNGFRQSDVLRHHNAGNHAAAARAFAHWNIVASQPNKGLTARRAAEAALYLTPVAAPYQTEPEPMPQVVDAPPTPATSTRVRTATVAAGAAVLDVLGQAGDNLGVVGRVVAKAKNAGAELLGAVGIPSSYVMPLLLAGVAVFLVRHFLRQRAQGVA